MLQFLEDEEEEEDKVMVETAMLQALLHDVPDENRVTLENLKDLNDEPESIDLKAPAVNNSYWCYRPGTDGRQKLEIYQCKAVVNCHTL